MLVLRELLNYYRNRNYTMQNNNLALGVAVVAIVIAIGGYFFPQVSSLFGSTGTRYPNGLSANTNSPAVGQLRGTNLLLDTSGTATSTAALGCIQVTATSTLTPVRLVIGNNTIATTTFAGTNSVFPAYFQYGNCPV